MSDVTTPKYSEREVNDMVRAHTGENNDIWEQHRTWKEIRISGVRILHAFKRQHQLYGARDRIPPPKKTQPGKTEPPIQVQVKKQFSMATCR